MRTCVNFYLLFAAAQPSLQAQFALSPGASRHAQKPTSITAAAQPLIRLPAIKFGPFHLSSSALGSHPTCDTSSTPTAAQRQPCGTPSPLETQSHLPPSVTRAAQQQEQPKTIPSRKPSTESPSNGSNKALARSVHKKSVEKERVVIKGRKRRHVNPIVARHLSHHPGRIALHLMQKKTVNDTKVP